MIFRIFQLDNDGRHEIRTLVLIDATSKNNARKRAASLLDNKEIYTTGFYDAIEISEDERQSEINKLQRMLNRYKNIFK